MEVSEATLSPSSGHMLWLALQCSARLALTQNEFHEEQWLILALIALWCAWELVGKFLTWNSKISFHSAAHGLALCCALSGIAFQKALFATLSAASPAERELLLALGETSKMSLIFFRHPIAELVLLLLVDSLLQLLLVQHQTLPSPQNFSGRSSVLLVVDMLFLALPLLLYAFGPWSSRQKTAEAPTGQRFAEQEDDATVSSAAATFMSAAAGQADAIDAMGSVELDESGRNVMRSTEQWPTASSDSFPIPKHCIRSAEISGLWSGDARNSGALSIEQLLLPLAALLLKNSGEAGAGPPAPLEDTEDAGERLAGRKTQEQRRAYKTKTFDGFETKLPAHATPSDFAREEQCHHYGTQGAPWLSGSSVTGTERQREDRDISTAPERDAAPNGCATTFWLPSQSEASAAGPSSWGVTSSTGGVPGIECNSKKPVPPIAQVNEETGSQQNTGSTPATESPKPVAKVQMHLTRENLLEYLRETIQANEELRQQALQTSGPTKTTKGMRVRDPSALQVSACPSIQPPYIREGLQGMAARPVAPSPKGNSPKAVNLVARQPKERATLLFYATATQETGEEERGSHITQRIATGDSPEAQLMQAKDSGGIVAALIGTGGSVQATEVSALESRPKTKRERESKEGSFSSTVASTLHSTQQARIVELRGNQEWKPAATVVPQPEPFVQGETDQEAQRHVDPPNRYSSWGEDKREVPWRKRSKKLLTVPMDPALPVILQRSLDGDRNSAFEPFESHEREEVGGPNANDKGSPVVRSAVLDPFVSPSAHTRHPPSVFWGRAGAFGASGTPMVSPRLLAGSCGFGTGKTVDDINVHKQSDLLFGTERHFQFSPNVALRCLDYEEAGAKSIETWRDRGENMNMGAGHYFGTPSVAMREPKVHGSKQKKLRKDIEQLRALAKERRGRCVDTPKEEAPKAMKLQPGAENGPPLRQNLPHGRSEQPLSGDSPRSDTFPWDSPAAWMAKTRNLAEVRNSMGVDRPWLARQGAVGASGTPMVILRPLERGPRTPQYPARRLPDTNMESESPSADFLRRRRYSIGNSESGDSLDQKRSSFSQLEGWDPISGVAAVTPVIVAVRNMRTPGGGPQWERTGAPGSCSCNTAKVYSQEVEREERILEGDERPSPMED